MSDTGAPSAGRTLARLFLLGASVAAPGCVGVTVAGAAQDAHLPLPATGTAAVLVSLALLARSRRLGARGMGLAGAGAALFCAAPLAWLSYVALGRGIELPTFLTAYQWDDPGVRYDVWLGTIAALGGLGLVGAFANFIPSLLGVGGARLRRWPVPSSGSAPWCSRLRWCAGPAFRAATVRVLSRPCRSWGGLPPVTGHADDGPVRAGDVTIMRTCALAGERPVFRCAFRFQRGGATFELAPSRRAFAHFRDADGMPALAPVDRPMIVRHDPRSDLWFVEAGGWPLVAGGATGRSAPVRVRDLAHVLAAPRGWRGAAALTLAIALLALLRARFAERRRRGAAGSDQDDCGAEADAHAAVAIAVAVIGTTPLLVAVLAGMAP